MRAPSEVTAILHRISSTELERAFADFDDGVEHDFADSTKFDVLYRKKRYPPKAIVGLAARHVEPGVRLGPQDFKGGEGSACFRVLKREGFAIEPKEWTREELAGAVSAYLEMLSSEQSGQQYSKAAFNHSLRNGPLRNRSKGSIEYRMQNISYVLSQLGRVWIDRYKPAKNVGANTARQIRELLEECGAVPQWPQDAYISGDFLDRGVREILAHGPSDRPNGARKPSAVKTQRLEYVRSAQVVAFVLREAGGICELCKNAAPFKRSDGTPYLEVHHIKTLSNGGSDTVENAAALCPNCHRRCHHAADRDSALAELYRTVPRLIRE